MKLPGRERVLARLCGEQGRVEVARHHHLRQPGVGRESHIAVDVALQREFLLVVFKTDVGEAQTVGTFRQGEREEAIFVGRGACAAGAVVDSGVDERFACAVSHVAAHRVSPPRGGFRFGRGGFLFQHHVVALAPVFDAGAVKKGLQGLLHRHPVDAWPTVGAVHVEPGIVDEVQPPFPVQPLHLLLHRGGRLARCRRCPQCREQHEERKEDISQCGFHVSMRLEGPTEADIGSHPPVDFLAVVVFPRRGGSVYIVPLRDVEAGREACSEHEASFGDVTVADVGKHEVAHFIDGLLPQIVYGVSVEVVPALGG